MELKKAISKLKEGIKWDKRSKLDKFLTIFFLILLILSILGTIYIIENPKQTEYFTEFYLLGPSGKAYDYPTQLEAGEKGNVIIGIVNHEKTPINYTVEIYLVNASYNITNTTINKTANNWYVINNITKLDKIENIYLTLTPLVTENWTTQWEYNYSFSINKTGNYHLWFILLKNNSYENLTSKQKIYYALDNKLLSLKLNVAVE